MSEIRGQKTETGYQMPAISQPLMSLTSDLQPY